MGDVGRVVVVGAGPCGIACARELLALGHEDVLVLEASDRAGGLAGSRIDGQGFTWDRGGHVVFSRFGEFDRLLADALGEEVSWHDRSSFVHVDGRFVPYPFQNNLHHLAPEDALECIIGLVEAQTANLRNEPADFGAWMLTTFGAGIVKRFMRPYNEKVWACRPETMTASWVAERVSVVDWRRALRALVDRVDDVDWGPNRRFAFPLQGGTGEIYRRAAAALGHRLRYEQPVEGVGASRREVTLASGETEGYDHLVWTGPLDQLVANLEASPGELRAAAAELVHTSASVVGLGYQAPLADDRSWFYFPEPAVPFYRVTNFAAYAEANVPESRVDRYCSYMAEVARPGSTPPPGPALADRVDRSLREVGLVAPELTVASVHVDDIEYAYPVPTKHRDEALSVIHPWLDSRHIYARGRFGSWRYEHGNMDHAVKMGVDVARRILGEGQEELWGAA